MSHIPSLKSQYNEQVIPALKKEFGYTSTMQVPKLEKIVINIIINSFITFFSFV